MTDTPTIDAPILDEAIRQFCNLQDIGYTDVRVLVADVLRAALPWDLPAERLASRIAVLRGLTLEAYRADPIMRELYPEKFR